MNIVRVGWNYEPSSGYSRIIDDKIFYYPEFMYSHLLFFNQGTDNEAVYLIDPTTDILHSLYINSFYLPSLTGIIIQDSNYFRYQGLNILLNDIIKLPYIGPDQKILTPETLLHNRLISNNKLYHDNLPEIITRAEILVKIDPYLKTLTKSIYYQEDYPIELVAKLVLLNSLNTDVHIINNAAKQYRNPIQVSTFSIPDGEYHWKLTSFPIRVKCVDTYILMLYEYDNENTIVKSVAIVPPLTKNNSTAISYITQNFDTAIFMYSDINSLKLIDESYLNNATVYMSGNPDIYEQVNSVVNHLMDSMSLTL